MLQKNIHNKVTIGTWITLAHPSIAEIMAASGFDWIAIDLEHSVITIREAEELIRVINLSGVTSLVRLTSNDPNQITRVMDAGSCGVIVPMVKSIEDVKQAVAAVKYPPYGNRSVGLARAQEYGQSFSEYLENYSYFAGDVVLEKNDDEQYIILKTQIKSINKTIVDGLGKVFLPSLFKKRKGR